MKFNNRGMGECVLLKDTKDTPYKLVYAIASKQFIIIDNLDIENETWGSGIYHGNNIDNALINYNKITNQEQKRDDFNIEG